MPVDDEKFSRLLSQLQTGGFEVTFEEREELRWHLGVDALDAKRLVHFASWLRGQICWRDFGDEDREDAFSTISGLRSVLYSIFKYIYLEPPTLRKK